MLQKHTGHTFSSMGRLSGRLDVPNRLEQTVLRTVSEGARVAHYRRLELALLGASAGDGVSVKSRCMRHVDFDVYQFKEDPRS